MKKVPLSIDEAKEMLEQVEELTDEARGLNQKLGELTNSLDELEETLTIQSYHKSDVKSRMVNVANML